MRFRYEVDTVDGGGTDAPDAGNTGQMEQMVKPAHSLAHRLQQPSRAGCLIDSQLTEMADIVVCRITGRSLILRPFITRPVSLAIFWTD